MNTFFQIKLKSPAGFFRQGFAYFAVTEFYAEPDDVIMEIIMEIIIAIIMAAAMDTTIEPDTESAGTLQMFLLKVVVFIFFDPVKNCAIKRKTSLRLITTERLEFYFLFLSTITSRAATNNNDRSHNNNADNVVEKLFHFILVSSQNAF